MGQIDLRAISTYNSSLGTGASLVSFQLNAFVTFSWNGTSFTYWAQDVLELDTSLDTGFFEDNLWNASSSPRSILNSSAISGNGTVFHSPSGDYYGATAAKSLPGSYPTLKLPATVGLEMNASLGPGGHPAVRFLYEDGPGWIAFDTLTFRFASSLSSFAGFVVSPRLQGSGCPRCYGDAELVAGGPYSGYQTALAGPTDVLLGLYDWNGRNFAAVPEASNYGYATAEGLTNGSVAAALGPAGAPGAVLTEGSIGLNGLWSQGSVASLEVSVLSVTGTGVLQLAGGSVPFSGGSVQVIVMPSNYTVAVTSSGGTSVLTNIVLVGGQAETLEVGGVPVVFVPQGLSPGVLWSVTLDNSTLWGTGPITFGSTNGTFNFTVAPLAHYTASPTAGSVNVTGSEVNVLVVWQAKPPTLLEEIVSTLELPVGPVPFYVVLGGLAALGIFSGLWGRRRRARRRRRKLEEGLFLGDYDR